jgi:multidrug resistance protein, MATE family
MQVEQSITQDSEEQDGLVLRFLWLTIANVLSNLMIPLATIFSTAFLGHLGEIHHLAGVALAGNLLSFLFLLLVSLRMGTTGLTSQAVGRGDREELLLVGMRNIILALMMGVALVVLRYPLQQLGLSWINASPEVVTAAINYFKAYILGSPAILINFVLLGWFLGREKIGKVILITVVSSVTNIAFDYLLVVHYGFTSAGAGVSYTISQYIVLLVGFILVLREVKWQEICSLTGKLWDIDALKVTFTLNSNILLNNLIFISAIVIFNYLGIGLGTTTYTENALLIEVATFNAFIAEGVGFGVEALSGNSKGRGSIGQLAPMLSIAITTSLFIGMVLAGLVIGFPKMSFGVLTNHARIINQIDTYVWWLLPCLALTSTALVLEAYFLGLTEGKTVRNVSLTAFCIGFLPVVVAAWKFQENHLLWLALCVFLVARTIGFGIQLPKTFKGDNTQSFELTASASKEVNTLPAK